MQVLTKGRDEQVDITAQQLLEAIEKCKVYAQEAATDAVRVCQLHDLTGHSEAWIRARIQQLMALGYVERVTMIVTRMDGISTTGHGYRLTEAGRKYLKEITVALGGDKR